MNHYIYDQEYYFLMHKDPWLLKYEILILFVFSFVFFFFNIPYTITKDYNAKVISKNELYFLVSEKESSKLMDTKMLIKEKEIEYEVVEIIPNVLEIRDYEGIRLQLRNEIYYEKNKNISIKFELERTTIGMYIFKTMKGWFLWK